MNTDDLFKLAAGLANMQLESMGLPVRCDDTGKPVRTDRLDFIEKMQLRFNNEFDFYPSRFSADILVLYHDAVIFKLTAHHMIYENYTVSFLDALFHVLQAGKLE